MPAETERLHLQVTKKTADARANFLYEYVPQVTHVLSNTASRCSGPSRLAKDARAVLSYSDNRLAKLTGTAIIHCALSALAAIQKQAGAGDGLEIKASHSVLDSITGHSQNWKQIGIAGALGGLMRVANLEMPTSKWTMSNLDNQKVQTIPSLTAQ